MLSQSQKKLIVDALLMEDSHPAIDQVEFVPEDENNKPITLKLTSSEVNMIAQIKKLKTTIPSIEEIDVEDVQARYKRHLLLLHRYNEIKDVVQAMLGKLAVIRGCTTAQLYPQFGLSRDD